MPNKTIYVSENDEKLFEEAKKIAGEALSSVISKALHEYVSRHLKKGHGMKEISLQVGKYDSEREKRFIGIEIAKWKGFSDDKKWWMDAEIFRTQKGSWVIYLTTICKATLLTNRKAWKESGDYLINPRESKLFVGQNDNDFENKIPSDLLLTLKNLIEIDEEPIEFLDI